MGGFCEEVPAASPNVQTLARLSRVGQRQGERVEGRAIAKG